MVDVVRDGARLIVSQRPSRWLSVIGTAWAAVVVAGFALFVDRVASGTWNTWVGAAELGIPLLVMLGLLRSWTKTECVLDRARALLTFERSGPLRFAEVRTAPLAAVARVVDRRTGAGRAIELVLADGSKLAVARSAAAENLDVLVRKIAKLLKKPVELGHGAVFGERFEIERLAGHGGMGVVYRARDQRTDEHVALKLVIASRDEPEIAERFERESRLLAEIEHPRIARHVAHGSTADRQAFLAMEWIDGEDLKEALTRGPLSLSDSLNVLRGVTEAVAAIHARGIVHRDLKPANVFLRDASPAAPVLLDFGIARGVESKTGLTATKALVGTPHYMAPEQASSSRTVQPAADVFSLGCIFHECLTGERPFESEQLVGVLARILHDDPSPPSALRPEVPEAWSNLVLRMLSKQPAQRPADGAALLEELASLPPADRALAPSTEIAASERQGADQVLVCVVLVAHDEAWPDETGAEQLESIRSAMQRFGCPIERLLDGSLLATILPKPSATDQVRIAARCALHLHEQLPKSRIAVATGHAPLGKSSRVGTAVDRAAELLGRAAEHVGIRLDDVSAGLLDVRFATKTREDTPFLVGENPDLDESRRLLGKPTPCVGRELELIQLEGILWSSIENSTPKSALVIGPPGSGKSRLRHELLRRLRDGHPQCTVLVGYGDPLSAGSPYVLLSDALRRHAGIRVGDDPEKARSRIVDVLCQQVAPELRQRISEFLGELTGVSFPVETSAPLRAARGDHRVMSEQIALAFYDWLAAECAAHPVVLVLDDLQWGDALTLKLLETGLRDLEAGALFVLALGRPEVEELFQKPLAAQRGLALSLRPLSNKASERLVKGVLGERVGAEPLARIVRLAAGNALFLEELIRAAAEGKAGDVPETVLAIIQARLSRMAPAARLVLRAASVLGEIFWRSGVRRVCQVWGSPDADLEGVLGELIAQELVVELRTSRFPGESEYAFRHALVRDAASGLLTDEDRAAAHRAAGQWLESVGETDDIVLARHAAAAGDRERAVSCYTRAAERSLELFDFDEALARASKVLELGPADDARGIILSVQCSAYFSMGRWTDSAALGLAALELLPRGGVYWCATVEKLMQVLPNVGDLTGHEKLSNALLEIAPTKDAQPAYLRALCAQVLGYAVTGDHARGRRCIELVDKLVTGEEHDLVLRGYANLWRGIYITILGAEPARALELVERAQGDLKASQVIYRLSLAHIVEAFCCWTLGDHERSERAARSGRDIAQRIHDSYHVALADWYLGLTLSEASDPDKLDEAEMCARTMVVENVSPVFEPTAKIVSAGAALAQGEWARAERLGRDARTGIFDLVPYALLASVHLMRSLTQLGRENDAAEVAREDLERIGRLEGPVFSEVPFRVAAAEALSSSGDRATAKKVLDEALKQIDRRARTIDDAQLRDSYLTGRPENRRAAELRAEWAK